MGQSRSGLALALVLTIGPACLSNDRLTPGGGGAMHGTSGVGGSGSDPGTGGPGSNGGDPGMTGGGAASGGGASGGCVNLDGACVSSCGVDTFTPQPSVIAKIC